MASSKKTAFQQAIEATSEVKDGYCSGLKAVKGSDRSKFIISDTSLIDGSLDIDSSVKHLYPNDNRWDYAVSYDNKLFFVEIHPAFDKEIKRMSDKLKWLKTWLKVKAPNLESLPKSERPFCWIASGETGFLPTSTSRRKIAMLGLYYENKMKLK